MVESGGTTVDRTETRVFLKDMLFHFDNVFHQRLNIFLLGESIGFAGALAIAKPEFARGRLVLAALAFVVTALLWWSLHRLQTRIDRLNLKYAELEPAYKEWLESGPGGLSSGMVQTTLIPLLAAIGWLIVVVWSVREICSRLGAAL